MWESTINHSPVYKTNHLFNNGEFDASIHSLPFKVNLVGYSNSNWRLNNDPWLRSKWMPMKLWN